jgi:hypothetical protein
VRSHQATTRSTPAPIRCLVLTTLTALLLATFGGSAMAASGWWRISAESAPTNLAPAGSGVVTVNVGDLGDATINGASSPITIIDKLPSGVTVSKVIPKVKNGAETSCSNTASVATCKFPGNLNPYEQLPIGIVVKVELPQGTVSTLSQEVTVEGGGVPSATRVLPLQITVEPTKYGVALLELAPFNEDGSPATQAGSQPFQFTTMFVLNQERERSPVELPKDVTFELPPGLVGNPTVVAQCSMTDFVAIVKEANLCPATSVVGVAAIVANEPTTGVVQKTVPVFNLTPSRGEPARFGFEVLGKIPVVIDTGVRSGGDYGVVVSVKDATQTAGLLSSQVTLWGDPGDPRHNASRGWECVAGGAFAGQVEKACPASSAEPETAFLRLPTSCAADPAAEPFVTRMSTDAWTDPGVFLGAEYAWLSDAGEPLGFTGCEQEPFTPQVVVVPVQHTASTPTGLTVNVEVPQSSTLTPGALAEADVRDTTVTLPEGVELSPSAANGLEACSEAQVGFTGFNPTLAINEFNTEPVSCPDGSKLGTVKIVTPLLSHPLQGAVYLASPAPSGASEPGRNPFNSLVALYLVAEDPVSGVLVKLAGEGQIEEGTLRVSTTFRNTPQVPFEDLELELFDGPRASVTTPSLCGSYSTDALFTPWSGTGPLAVSSAGDLAVTSGVGGSACPASVPFSPGFLAQSEDQQAGAFTSFNLELSRPDGDQALSALSMHLPPGVAAMLSSVELCSAAQAAASACSPGSEVGQAMAVAGLGSEPYTETGGRVFITGPYGGAPFGLEIVTPAVAGPFNLGFVTVRSKLFIDPNNASVTIVSDPLPTQLRGIPLQLKRVIVNVDRPGFQFNPTDCSPMSINGTISGSEGASVGVSSPFQVGGCAALPFSPRLTASAGGRGSKADGTSLDVKVESGGVGPGGVAQAGIAKVDLQLPLALSSRLPTLQKACVEAVFDVDPASCDEGSVIGEATIHTPVLKSPLVGPAYLVSHGGAEFPDVEFVLQGEGITLVLDGKTDIKHGITYSRFESAPDAPFTVFETELPAGPHGVLAPNVPEKEDFSLCKASLAMPTEITGQNGAVINQTTNIAVTGCGGVLPSKTAKPTRAQLLAKALKACRKHKHKRLACEKQARKRYAPKKPAHKAAHRPARNATTTGQHSK